MSLDNPIVQKINKRDGKYYSIHVPNKLVSKLRLDTSSNDSPNYCKIYYDPQNEQLIFKKLELNLEEGETK